ncbi:hypothetical protein DFJ74DRAFT_693057 [Hyaloraphidium curvatum]|nr:hypothetical protein DFJ74DRAFT_693057 [Hyaloraphidium curvatum]
MHALGAATSLRSTLPGTLTTEPLPANGSSFAGFSPLTAFDGRLVDTATGTLLSRTWERVVHFAADNWPDGFRGSSEAAAAHELYESATTPGGVAFSASSGILIPLDTSAKPFQNGRSLSHLPDSATAPDGLFASTAPRGPLPSSVFRHTDQGPVLQLPSPVAAMLSTLGWTTCDADPEACGTVFVGGSTEAQGGSQPAPLPVWAIALIAVAGAVALGMLVAGLFVVRSRRHKRDAPAESPKARDPEVGSVRSARTPSFDSFFLPPSPPPDRLPSPAVPAQAHLTVSRSPSSTSSQTSLSLSSSRRLPAPDIFLPRTGSADSLASRYSLDPAYPPPAQAMHPASRSLPASRMPRNLLQTSSPSSPTRSRAARSMHPAARSLPSSALRASQADAMWTTDELARYTERVMREQEMLPSGAYRPASGSLSLGSHASDSDSDSESYYSVPRRSASGGIPAGPAIIGFEELRDEPRNAPLRGGSGSLPPRRRSGPVRMQVRPGMEGGFRSLPARRYGAGSELRG